MQLQRENTKKPNTLGLLARVVVGREVTIGSNKLPEIKTLFDVYHNSYYFLGAYCFLYAKWSSDSKQKTGLEDGQPTRKNKLS